MNDYVWAGQVTALLAIVAGILICFWGYRILKVTLGIIGFIAGAYGGWELGVSFIHASPEIALGCALIGGLVCMGLSLWLYLLGIFLVGVTAGVVMAAAFFSGTTHQAPPIVFLTLPIVFGVIALVAQKFMIVVSTAFGGSYLIVAGVWPFILGTKASRIWLHPAESASPGTLGYAALVLWLVLAVVGVTVQFRAGYRKVEVVSQQT